MFDTCGLYKCLILYLLTQYLFNCLWYEWPQTGKCQKAAVCVLLCRMLIRYLNCGLQQSMYLRDVLDNMCCRKLRETTDFEWRRSVRCYMHPSGEMSAVWVSHWCVCTWQLAYLFITALDYSVDQLFSKVITEKTNPWTDMFMLCSGRHSSIW